VCGFVGKFCCDDGQPSFVLYRYADGTDKVYVARSEAEARAQAEKELGAGVSLTQDEDVSLNHNC